MPDRCCLSLSLALILAFDWLALLSSRIHDAPTHPLPRYRIAGVPNHISASRKRRRALQPVQEPQPKKARTAHPVNPNNEPRDENSAGAAATTAVGQGSHAMAPASRAPLAPVANQNAPAPGKSAQSVRLGTSAGPAARPTEFGFISGGCGTTVATGMAAPGIIVKAEAQDDRAMLNVSFNTTPDGADMKVKAEPKVELALQRGAEDKMEALRREILKTYDADVQSLADNARLREAIAQIQKRVDRCARESLRTAAPSSVGGRGRSSR
ncbi:uncharacterized protein B0H18DRAFT_665475 [Fomitopsis serialis]|uniref:uncharacterized protein n=1 Tax=Fomitopsis serialis TaxID=139415 RepID=UPI002008E26F|nr:uncharacterized protein B0H18DRAFT_665475 [Neoantrodia serialis]KAH9918610.1 hypothetical protein B0H18DRAFT_665475 [Neoantrodia serialis]